jgi:hypothetical protein
VTAGDVKRLVLSALEFEGDTHTDWIRLVNKSRYALAACVVLTAEETETVRNAIGFITSDVEDDRITDALALLIPDQATSE